jgi:hypothetical protein
MRRPKEEREMSDEQRKDEEIEVEGHLVEVAVNDEADEESDFEAHMQRASNVRME